MPGAEITTDYWVSEYLSPTDIFQHGIVRMLAWQRTAFQEMSVVESGRLGKALVLDGKWQSCTGDECLYHEPLVQPACYLHGSPRTALILGGGEGATARELLRWKTIERVTMVDIDGEVVEACRQHLPEMHQGAFDDPRMDLVIGDALQYVADPATKPEGGWDIIISDLSDPIAEGPSYPLFTREYYQSLADILAPKGHLVVQSGSVSPVETRMHAGLARTLRDVFPHTSSYTSPVPGYASIWSYIITHNDPWDALPDPDDIDRVLADNLTSELRMLDGRAMLGLFQIPKYLRHAIETEDTVFTLDNPPKFFGEGVKGA
ncbi:MAG: spermidine synthase [Phycisphaerales bacterium JB037]